MTHFGFGKQNCDYGKLGSSNYGTLGLKCNEQHGHALTSKVPTTAYHKENNLARIRTVVIINSECYQSL